MTINSTKVLLANTMMIGVIMTICSNNWISMWMGLEMSLLSFIPFMQTSKTISSESMIKYFIMQSVASTMMLLSVAIMLIGVSMMAEMILTIAMLIKIGAVPFHNWVLMIIETLSYYTMLTLLTVIKIPPLTILYQINSKMLNIPIMMSMLISSIACLNQSSMRKTLAYSSIYNMAMMLLVINSFSMTMTYMIIYSTMLVLLVSMVTTLKINFINQLIFNEYDSTVKINLWINMLSMSGFPPMIGFLGKIIILQAMILNMEILLTIVLVLTSMLVIMFYTRLAFTSMMVTSITKKWMDNKTNSMFYMMFTNIMLTPALMSFIEVY
uniref:NADH dehydrogenase subunit 2 n=1 Tax=Phlogothamnus polymaculatus TaxID=2897054 RepID=UPI001EDD8F55|nr:NADH dehydrogenase subunit 2 [Phlogothamnus polymaculatus]UKE80378.1 NADH dehydrogenase subunit 2 [Phlogothamnus polymaculatus]